VYVDSEALAGEQPRVVLRSSCIRESKLPQLEIAAQSSDRGVEPILRHQDVEVGQHTGLRLLRVNRVQKLDALEGADLDARVPKDRDHGAEIGCVQEVAAEILARELAMSIPR
jgi:hypothetical protein